MAQLFPSLETIKKFKVKPQPGELYLLEFLQNNLNNSYEVYFQPFLNGDNPDIVLMRKGSGVLIIEVKDWRLASYYTDSGGKWRLKLENVLIKSPISQVEAYKENLYYLHIDQLLEEKMKQPKLWAVVACAVYFHNETEASVRNFCPEAKSTQNYTRLLGQDSLTKQKFTNLLNDLGVGDRRSRYFDEKLYHSFRHYLRPSEHTTEQGKPLTYTKEQQALINSEAKEQKVLGVAGSGKTFVLAKRAVNAYLRTGGKILILTFNITLRNYIHDRISEVREGFPWRNFHITHYHLFFALEANNQGLLFGEQDFEDEDFFEFVKDKIKKYDAIFIDEIQDYEKSWVKTIRRYFLAENGEFVVFGDEKQNVYHRGLGDDKRPYTGISGQWNKLNQSQRLKAKAAQVALDFQRHFWRDRYILDEIQIMQGQLDFGEESIKYQLLDRDTSINHICEVIISEIKHLDVRPNDVAILSLRIEFLRELDFLFRNSTRQKTTTAFETKDMWEAVKSQRGPREEHFKFAVEKIRRGMKFRFWANAGTTKLSTIHSFKGWEIHTLFLIIEDEQDIAEEEIVTEELIYTGITRCKCNLVIINIGNQKYHEFFASLVLN